MTLQTFDRILLACAMLSFLFGGLVLPSLRVRRRTGAPAFVFHRGAWPHQRLVGLAFGACVGAISAGAALFSALGPEAVGVGTPTAWMRLAGYSMVCAGLVLLALAERDMGASWRIGIPETPAALVTGGLFARVRNPVFSSMLVALAGGVLVAPSAFSIAGWIAAAALIHAQVRFEERHLLESHGGAYRAYAARVGRFVPGIGRLGAGEEGGLR